MCKDIKWKHYACVFNYRIICFNTDLASVIVEIAPYERVHVVHADDINQSYHSCSIDTPVHLI